jgi:hypothetical protein
MAGLLIRMSIADILLVEKIINTYMKENNIEDIDDVPVKEIQEKYDEIMKKQMWKNPDEF